MVFHLLQHASGVDHNLGIVKECSIGVVGGLNLDLPPAFVCLALPPGAGNQMAQLDVGVEFVLRNHAFQVSQDLLVRCIAVFLVLEDQ
jgi:hypothetical protein